MIRQLLKVSFVLILSSFSSAFADEASVKKAVEAFLKETKVDEVRKLSELGLYEVRIGNDILYADDKVTFLFSGTLIDVKTRRNLTQARQTELSTIKFSELPLDSAVKIVRGKGTRVIATFEDPNCPYCKKLAKDLLNVKDVTVYTFLLPILSDDSRTKSNSIWCAPDRAKAWNDFMVNNKTLAPAPAGCSAPNDKVRALAEKYRINGTPTIFLSNGQRIPGFVSAEQLEEMLKTASK
jgi:thiol:disulfide interchange protein DsbC